jgi:sulfite reductase (NADPH) flavoprotein alpha-component
MNAIAPLVPVMPDSAPFSEEQRAYLNGFLAGLFSWTPANAAPAQPAVPATTLTVLYGSQTGGAEKAAKKLAKLAGQRGFKATIRDMGETKPVDIAAAGNLLVIASTYGDGEPPDRARDFWAALSNGAPRMEKTRFSVLALGDSSYTKFCEFGRQLDARFAELGAQRVVPRRDCDVEWTEHFEDWIAEAFSALGTATPVAPASEEEEAPAFDRDSPCPSPFTVNRLLSGASSAKDVRHFEFSLEGTGLTYACGDALGVWPENDPAMVQEILDLTKLDGATLVTGRKKQQVTLREALLRHFEITRIPQSLLLEVTAGRAVETISASWCEGRDIVDLLRLVPDLKWEAPAFTALLRSLSPRLYSISSSPAAHSGSVHLTVSAVRYESHGRQRHGLCSTFLADRLPAGDPARIFVHENNNFRPPAGDVPLIMIGPGTGIAPFRGFLHDRAATGAKGRNWLFFGDQHAASDYLYQEEIEGFHASGLLTRLDLAWSRDSSEKVYVQHLMLAAADEIWAWLNEGACICVCGDATRMARDVDTALHRIIETVGGKTPDEAAAWVKRLQSERRYQRDVY